jgi:hypothetical protein
VEIEEIQWDVEVGRDELAGSAVDDVSYFILQEEVSFLIGLKGIALLKWS